MSVKKFIETGIIESYVMGLCTPDELKQVKAMKAKHPTVVDEIKAVRKTLLSYALKHEVKPPEQLKDKILSAVKSPEKKSAEKKLPEKEKETKIREEIKHEVKPPEKIVMKISEVKTLEIKPPDVKAPEIKPEVKITELKAPERKPIELVKKPEEKPLEKSLEEKLQERKTVQEKLQETKKEETKPPQAQIPEKKVIAPPPVKKDHAKGFETVKSFLIAATLALLLVSAFFGYMLYQRLQVVKQKLANERAEKELLVHRLQTDASSWEQRLAEKQTAIDQQTTTNENLRKDLAVLMKSFKAVTLTGEAAATLTKKELHPGALATVYWNPVTKEAHISVQNLPAPDSTHQYQLWAMADGKAVDAGMIVASESNTTLQRMKDVNNVQLFAVTLEKRGGSLKPSFVTMYLAGKVS